jgi:hypothetical protein
MARTAWYPVRVRPLGIVMAPNPADPYAAGGVVHPAVARGPEGHLDLLPRSVWRASPCGGRGAAVRGWGHGAPLGSGLGPGEARR